MAQNDEKTWAELRRLIEADCLRVQKLGTLSAEDRNGKYRAAIGALFERLKKNGSEFLKSEVYGGFLTPNTRDFHARFFDGWVLTDDFAARRDAVRDALLAGDFERFLHRCTEIRDISRRIVAAYGGKEEQ